MKTLDQMTEEVMEFCKAKGWYDKPVSFGEAMVLLHSEVSEALEAFRQWGTDDATYTGTACHIPGTCPHSESAHKPEGVGSEFADVLIRLLDDCDRFGIDLQAEYERKMAYNRTMPYRHGKKNM